MSIGSCGVWVSHAGNAARGVAGDHRVGRDIRSHYSPRTNNTALSHCHTGEYHRTAADPDIVTNLNLPDITIRGRFTGLSGDGLRGMARGIEDYDVSSDPAVVADRYSPAYGELAVVPYSRAVSDHQLWRIRVSPRERNAALTVYHHVIANDYVAAPLDVMNADSRVDIPPVGLAAALEYRLSHKNPKTQVTQPAQCIVHSSHALVREVRERQIQGAQAAATTLCHPNNRMVGAHQLFVGDRHQVHAAAILEGHRTGAVDRHKKARARGTQDSHACFEPGRTSCSMPLDGACGLSHLKTVETASLFCGHHIMMVSHNASSLLS